MPAAGYGQGRWLRTFLIARGPRADQLDDRPVHLSLRAETRVNLARPEAECPLTPRAARNRTVAKPPFTGIQIETLPTLRMSNSRSLTAVHVMTRALDRGSRQGMGGQDTHPRCAMHTVNWPYRLVGQMTWRALLPSPPHPEVTPERVQCPGSRRSIQNSEDRADSRLDTRIALLSTVEIQFPVSP
jgi:hypothetical protein